MPDPVTITVDPSFSRRILEWANLKGKTIPEAFKTHGRLLFGELISSTPPFSGGQLKLFLSGRALNKNGSAPQLSESELGDMTARQIGVRRVEKDIRHVMYGVQGASYSARQRKVTGATEKVDFGVMQRCEGRQAFRIFATKSGTVYGTDAANFKPSASMEEMHATHKKHRTKRGRVTTAGSRTRNIGRWKWLDILITKEANLKKYIRSKANMVGQAKGAWAHVYMALGGRMSPRGWIGKHADSGTSSVVLQPFKVEITGINQSAWASSGDPEGFIQKAIARRERTIAADIERLLKDGWRKAA